MSLFSGLVLAGISTAGAVRLPSTTPAASLWSAPFSAHGRGVPAGSAAVSPPPSAGLSAMRHGLTPRDFLPSTSRKHAGCLAALLLDVNPLVLSDISTPSASLSPCVHPDTPVCSSASLLDRKVASSSVAALQTGLSGSGDVPESALTRRAESRTWAPSDALSQVFGGATAPGISSQFPVLPLLKSFSGSLSPPSPKGLRDQDGEEHLIQEEAENGKDVSPSPGEAKRTSHLSADALLTEAGNNSREDPRKRTGRPHVDARSTHLQAAIHAAVGLAVSDALRQVAKLNDELEELSRTLLRMDRGDAGEKGPEKSAEGSVAQELSFETLDSIKLPLEGSTAQKVLAGARQSFRNAANASLSASAQDSAGLQGLQETEVATELREGEERLLSIVDSALRSIFQEQMNLLVFHILQLMPSSVPASPVPGAHASEKRGHQSSSFHQGGERNPPSPVTAGLQQFENLLKRSVPAAEQRKRWGANPLRLQLQRQLLKWEKERNAERSRDTRQTRSQQALLQVLQRQQEQLEQLQQHIQQSQQPTPLSFGAAYRVPDTNLQLAAAARQGKLHLNLSCLPDEAAAAGAAGGILGSQGFVKGVEAAGNLGVSVNFGL
ncbi:hypothetical protein BESB_067130 [Besnoitia besnoiti]|uniref:Uncharacterized protein n=1 Tax=Besnoitia besnoiti TaxID=94643 RepID=A0A2A9MGX8_BESBE|nr:hypothetical protein BESB_067130 [Besnoitia besnoiti]PFH34680.1 hypothetical protein BESB_067130 [Besnoitia besnoiti]